MYEQRRRHPRHKVHLKVHYSRAVEFVEQYADTLALGGMFIRDATELVVGEEVSITLELPGSGTLTVKAEVRYVLTEGSKRGAGLLITNGPRGYLDLLSEYLLRLGRRTNAVVFVDAEPWRTLIQECGYQVAALPLPTKIASIFSDLRLVAIMPPVALADEYDAALQANGADSSLLIPVHAELPVDPVLAWLDERLLDR
ncbi:MAG: PilZ domain-containing protein [Kofleriaceae bacterium]